MWVDPSGYMAHGNTKNIGANTSSSATAGYYTDANGKWHRPNGQFASNAEVGIPNNVKPTSANSGSNMPNPNGKKGGIPHQTEVANIQPKNTGTSMQEEFKFDTSNGGNGYNNRYADKVELDGDEVVNIYQVGKVDANSMPVTREAKAIEDIMNSPDYNGAPIYFIPYNSSMGPILYTP